MLARSEMGETSSRLCVKNIPGYVDEARLREHFGQKGDITDARVIRASDGHSRQFGFVGYKTAGEAQHALEHFNSSYLDSSKISIQFAYQRGSEAAPQAWSKYTPGTSAHSRAVAFTGDASNAAIEGQMPKAREAKKQKRQNKDEDDPALQEFLQAMQPRSKANIWSNDVTATSNNIGSAKGGQKPARPTPRVSASDPDSSDDEYTDLPAGRAEGLGAASDSDADDCHAVTHQDATVTDTAVSDMDYLRSRMRKSGQNDEGEEEEEKEDELNDDSTDTVSSNADASEDDISDVTKRQPAKDGSNSTGKVNGSSEAASERDPAVYEDEWEHEAGGGIGDEERRRSGNEADSRPEVIHATEAADQIGETGRLFLRNLSYAATEEDLTELLGSHGDLQEIHLVVDRVTHKSKGIALVQFTNAVDAVAAHAALDAKVFQGRLLHVLPGHRPPQPKTEEDPGSQSFKEKRETQRKQSGGDRTSWNSLYMRPDTVADAIAAQLGVTKSEFLDSSHDDLAVRQALGEARVLAATKAALGDTGVSIKALESAAASAGHSGKSAVVKRSTDTILVKNLPFQVTEQELQDMFGKRGAIARLVLPDTRGLALIEFESASDARMAFKGLAYRRLHQVPLYLEWAPAGIWTQPVPRKALNSSSVDAAVDESKDDNSDRVAASAAVQASADLAGAADGADADDSNDLHTLFVKNLAWKTGDVALRRAFEKAASAAGGSVRSAKVAVRSDKKAADGSSLSMGYGFVECSSGAVAQAVLKQLQGTNLDGHKLLIQLSQHQQATRGANASSARDSKAPTKAAAAKLVVRNVAFEATRKDIVGLFAPYGHIKSARLPSKFDGQHRGFAFVEFGSKQEAAAAMEATAGTHLYGRRLVVETAAEEAGLDELRAKTAAKFHDSVSEDAVTAKSLRQKLPMVDADVINDTESSDKKRKTKRKRVKTT